MVNNGSVVGDVTFSEVTFNNRHRSTINFNSLWSGLSPLTEHSLSLHDSNKLDCNGTALIPSLGPIFVSNDLGFGGNLGQLP